MTYLLIITLSMLSCALPQPEPAPITQSAVPMSLLQSMRNTEIIAIRTERQLHLDVEHLTRRIDSLSIVLERVVKQTEEAQKSLYKTEAIVDALRERGR